MVEMRDPQTFAIIGAAMSVHRELGHGFLEAVYREAMEMELMELAIAFEMERSIPIRYKKKLLKTKYRADFICFGDIIIELKAISHDLTGTDRAQVINYLKATGMKRALLINFGKPSLQYERVVLNA